MAGVSAECKKLRGPNDTGPDCGCRGDSCALGRDAARRRYHISFTVEDDGSVEDMGGKLAVAVAQAVDFQHVSPIIVNETPETFTGGDDGKP